MLRVCIIAQQSVGMVGGGPLVQLRETAEALPRFGVEVEYFDQWKGIDRERVDLVHLFNASLMTYDTARRLVHFGIPYVVSPIFYSNRSPASIRLARKASRLVGKGIGVVRTDFEYTAEICRGAELVLPNTTDEADLIAEGMEIDREKIRVVPNGVDTAFAEATPDLFVEEYGIRDFVLNVGHIGSGRKNVLRLMEAMRGVDRDLVVIGKIHRGGYAEACLEEAEKNSRIHVIEGLPNDSPLLASAYAACRVFALPSIFETPGIAALEAAVAGASIVITPVGGTRDYFRDDAHYVDPDSIESIRAGIVAALAEPVPERLAARIAEEYSWERVAEQTAAAYRDVIGGSE